MNPQFDSEYHLGPAVKTFPSATNYCKSLKSHLVKIESTEEKNFLRLTLGRKKFWLGLSNLNGTDYKWFDGSDLSYTSWYRSSRYQEPECSAPCCSAFLAVDGSWMSRACHKEFHPLCERNAKRFQEVTSYFELPEKSSKCEEFENAKKVLGSETVPEEFRSSITVCKKSKLVDVDDSNKFQINELGLEIKEKERLMEQLSVKNEETNENLEFLTNLTFTNFERFNESLENFITELSEATKNQNFEIAEKLEFWNQTFMQGVETGRMDCKTEISKLTTLILDLNYTSNERFENINSDIAELMSKSKTGFEEMIKNVESEIERKSTIIDSLETELANVKSDLATQREQFSTFMKQSVKDNFAMQKQIDKLKNSRR